MGQQQTEIGSALRRRFLVLLVAALTLVVLASAIAVPGGATKKGAGGAGSKVQACSVVRSIGTITLSGAYLGRHSPSLAG
jgi:hypothetical protein